MYSLGKPQRKRGWCAAAQHAAQDLQVFLLQRGDAVGQLTADALAVLVQLLGGGRLAAGAALRDQHRRCRLVDVDLLVAVNLVQCVMHGIFVFLAMEAECDLISKWARVTIDWLTWC